MYLGVLFKFLGESIPTFLVCRVWPNTVQIPQGRRWTFAGYFTSSLFITTYKNQDTLYLSFHGVLSSLLW